MKNTRRELLLAAVSAGVVIPDGCTIGKGLLAAEEAALVASRKRAAHRRRRIIFNNDGDDIWAKGADTVERFLAVRHTPLLDTMVDSIYYSTTQSFNYFTHQTQVAEVFTSRTGTAANNNLASFLKNNTDGLRMSCEFAHRHGLESIWTLRMNDIHDADRRWSYFLPQWKKADPRRVMSTPEEASKHNDRRSLWTFVDYENPEVEARLVAIIEEVLRGYPVNGVELDFLRHPLYFRPTFEGRPVADKHIDVLTQIVTSIRKLVLRESERQQKPLLLAVRVPPRIQLCRNVGIDIRGWLANRLIDTLAVGGSYGSFAPVPTEMIELGHRHDVPVYPVLDYSGFKYPWNPRRRRFVGDVQPVEAWNGAALRQWEAGANGVYVFNLFPEQRHDYALTVLKTIGSRERTRNSNRMFAIDIRGPIGEYMRGTAPPGVPPIRLRPGAKSVVPLPVAGQVDTRGGELAAQLRLDFTGLGSSQGPSVTFNGRLLEGPRRAEGVAGVRRLEYAVQVVDLKTGKNLIGLQIPTGNVELAGAELWLQQRPTRERE